MSQAGNVENFTPLKENVTITVDKYPKSYPPDAKGDRSRRRRKSRKNVEYPSNEPIGVKPIRGFDEQFPNFIPQQWGKGGNLFDDDRILDSRQSQSR